jgi:hypothetical protein
MTMRVLQIPPRWQAHGAAYLLHDRLHACSDYSVMDVCAACGSLLAPTHSPPPAAGAFLNRLGAPVAGTGERAQQSAKLAHCVDSGKKGASAADILIESPTFPPPARMQTQDANICCGIASILHGLKASDALAQLSPFLLQGAAAAGA